LILTKINCITLKIRSKADFKSKSQNILTADHSVFQYSNANDMRVTHDFNSFGEIIAHAECSIDEKKIIYIPCVPHKNNCPKKLVHTT
jgi:formylmethanofuran dehydrogenase subunit D